MDNRDGKTTNSVINYVLSNQISAAEMSETRSTRESSMHTEFNVQHLKARAHFRDLTVDGRTILKWTLKILWHVGPLLSNDYVKKDRF